MNDLLLKGMVGIQNARVRFAHNFAERREAGDIVQTIIIIAAMVLACIAVFALIVPAINDQAGHVADCIKSSNSGKCANYDPANAK